APSCAVASAIATFTHRIDRFWLRGPWFAAWRYRDGIEAGAVAESAPREWKAGQVPESKQRFGGRKDSQNVSRQEQSSRNGNGKTAVPVPAERRVREKFIE